MAQLRLSNYLNDHDGTRQSFGFTGRLQYGHWQWDVDVLKVALVVIWIKMDEMDGVAPEPEATNRVLGWLHAWMEMYYRFCQVYGIALIPRDIAHRSRCVTVMIDLNEDEEEEEEGEVVVVV